MFRYVGYHVNFHFGFLVGWVVTAGERNKGLKKPLFLERFSGRALFHQLLHSHFVFRGIHNSTVVDHEICMKCMELVHFLNRLAFQ